MGPWVIWLWRLLRNKRFRRWLLATAGPRAIALFLLFVERARHRQIAIGEADQIDGMFSVAIVDGERHLIVWKDGEPVSAYPPVSGDLAAKLKTHVRRDLKRPEDLPTRKARRALGEAVRRARGGASHVGEGASHAGERARSGASHLGEGARSGAAHLGEGARALRRLLPGGRDEQGAQGDEAQR